MESLIHVLSSFHLIFVSFSMHANFRKINPSKEVFNQDVLSTDCLVVASLVCYVIEVLPPGDPTGRRFLFVIVPLFIGGNAYGRYRLLGKEIPVCFFHRGGLPEFRCAQALAFVDSFYYIGIYGCAGLSGRTI